MAKISDGVKPKSKTQSQKRSAWEKKYYATYDKLADAAGHKDSIGSITSTLGQALSSKARTMTNKAMGYTEKSVQPKSKHKYSPPSSSKQRMKK